MKPLRSLGLCLLMLMLLLSMLSCTRSTAPPIRVASNLWPGYEPLYLAEELGFWNGDQVRMQELASATEVIRAYRNQSVNAACLTLDEAMGLIRTEPDSRIILIMDFSSGGDAIIAQPGFSSFRDLAGKRIGLEQTALGTFFLSRALEKHGMSMEQVELHAKEFNYHEELFRKQLVDAVVTFEPVRSQLLAAGGVELFSSREIPNEIIDVLVVREELLEQNPEAVEALLHGWFLALDCIHQQPDRALLYLGPRLELESIEELRALYRLATLPSFEEVFALMEDPESSLLPISRKLAGIMKSNGLLDAEPDYNKLFDARALTRLDQAP